MHAHIENGKGPVMHEASRLALSEIYLGQGIYGGTGWQLGHALGQGPGIKCTIWGLQKMSL